MATKIEEAFIEVQIDLSKVNRNLASLEKRSQKATVKIDQGFKKAKASVLSFAGAFALLEVGRGLSALVQLSSDAEEISSKFDVVFGESREEIRKFAEGLSESLGRSRIDLEKFLSTAQDLFVPIKGNREEAAKLSKQVVQLALDLGSFNNVKTEDALQRIQSALVGNSEAVRSFGVNIDETRLKQQLLKDGIIPLNGQFTQQQKVLGRLKIISEDTADAQTDLLRTQGSLENVSRRLEGDLKDVGTTIGDILAPAIRNAKLELIDLIERFEDLGKVASGDNELENAARLQEIAVELGRRRDLLIDASRRAAEASRQGRFGKRDRLELELAIFQAQLQRISALSKEVDQITGRRETGEAARTAPEAPVDLAQIQKDRDKILKIVDDNAKRVRRIRQNEVENIRDQSEEILRIVEDGLEKGIIAEQKAADLRIQVQADAAAEIFASDEKGIKEFEEAQAESADRIQGFFGDAFSDAFAQILIDGEVTANRLAEIFIRELGENLLRELFLDNLIANASKGITSGLGAAGDFLGEIFSGNGNATGAIVSRPTLALIGERGPEMVAPLTGPNRLVGGGSPIINISTDQGIEIDSIEQGTSGGENTLDIRVTNTILRDLGTNGPIAKTLRQRGGLSGAGQVG